MCYAQYILTVAPAPLGYFYNAPHALGGGTIHSPLLFPKLVEACGPSFKIQTAFDSHATFVDRNLALLTSGSLMT